MPASAEVAFGAKAVPTVVEAPPDTQPLRRPSGSSLDGGEEATEERAGPPRVADARGADGARPPASESDSFGQDAPGPSHLDAPGAAHRRGRPNSKASDGAARMDDDVGTDGDGDGTAARASRLNDEGA